MTLAEAAARTTRRPTVLAKMSTPLWRRNSADNQLHSPKIRQIPVIREEDLSPMASMRSLALSMVLGRLREAKPPTVTSKAQLITLGELTRMLLLLLLKESLATHSKN